MHQGTTDDGSHVHIISGGWQPIETAPEDTAILVWNAGFIIAHFNTKMGFWVGLGLDTSDTRSLKQYPPTQWMPLPPQPTNT